MDTIWRGCSAGCGFRHVSSCQGGGSVSQGKELPLRSKRGGSVKIYLRNGSRSRGGMCQTQVMSTSTMITARACVCRAASCFLESDLSDKEDVGMRNWSPDDEIGDDDYGDCEPYLLRPVTVEKPTAGTRSAASASSVSGLGGKAEHLGSRLHFLEERDEEVLSKRLIKLSQSNKVRSAGELFDSMLASGLQPSAHACNSILSSRVRKCSLADALKIFDFMKRRDMATGHTYTLILKAVASGKGHHAALKMFNELEEEHSSKKTLDVIAYNTMISVCGRAKDWKQAEKMWRRLGESSLNGTLMTYDLLVSTFVQCGQPELAIAAYNEMLHNGLDPSEDIMKAIIASCTKEGKWEFALATFRRMLSSGMKPNIISFNSVINSLGKAGEDELAFRMYHLLTSLGLQPDVYTWSALLSALYRSDRYWDALELFQRIKVRHSSLLNSHLFNIALMSCERLGRWEHALQLLWEMEKSRIQMSAASYNHVICACEVARKPKVALEVYRHMIHRKCLPDTFTHVSVIRACIWGSLWKEIENILEEVAPDSSMYNAVIHGLCLRGKIRLARKVYKKMQTIGLKPDGKTRSFMLQHFATDES